MSRAQLDALNKRATLESSEVLSAAKARDYGLDEQSVPIHEHNSVLHPHDASDVQITVARPGEARPLTDVLQDDEDSSPASEPLDLSADLSPGPRLDPVRPQPPPPDRPTPFPSPAPTPIPMHMPTPVPMHAPAPSASGQPPMRPSAPIQDSNRLPMIAGIVLGVGVLGAGAFYAYNEFIKKKDDAVVVADKGSAIAVKTGSGNAGSGSASGSAGSAASGSGSSESSVGSGSAETGSGSAVESGSAGSGSAGSNAGSTETGSGSAVAVTTPDAGTGSGAGTGSAEAPEIKPASPSDNLQVTSKPKGARVFIDGADQGTTPVKVPGSADKHTLAVLLPNHELYLGEVSGQGVYNIDLKPITPNGGHAGIKVLKCKKERYYVYVDGAPTGMTCPTERIDTTVGPHVVEVYDIVTDTRRKFDIVVKDERLSVRVKID